MDYPVLVAPRSQIGVIVYNVLVFLAGAILIVGGFFLEGQRHMFYDIYGTTFALSLFVFVIVAITAGVICIDMSFYRGSLVVNNCQVITLGFTITLICTMEISAFLSGSIMKGEVERQTRENLFDELRLYRANSTTTNWIDLVQQWLACCGIDSWEDWIKSHHSAKIPDSCCRVELPNCALEANGNVSRIFTEGCMDTFDRWMDQDIFIFAVAALLLCLMQITGIILFCCMQRKGSDYRAINSA